MMKEVIKKLPKTMAKQFKICAAVDSAIRQQMAMNESQKHEYWDELKKDGLIPENNHSATIDHAKGVVTYRIFENKRRKTK